MKMHALRGSIVATRSARPSIPRDTAASAAPRIAGGVSCASAARNIEVFDSAASRRALLLSSASAAAAALVVPQVRAAPHLTKNESAAVEFCTTPAAPYSAFPI